MGPPPRVFSSLRGVFVTPIAHAGHWIANLLYVGPVVVVVGALVWQSWRDKRAAQNEEHDR